MYPTFKYIFLTRGYLHKSTIWSSKAKNRLIGVLDGIGLLIFLKRSGYRSFMEIRILVHILKILLLLT